MERDRRGAGDGVPGPLATQLKAYLFGAGIGALVVLTAQAVRGERIALAPAVTVLVALAMGGALVGMLFGRTRVGGGGPGGREPADAGWRTALTDAGAVLWEAEAADGEIRYMAPEAVALFGCPLEEWYEGGDPWEWVVDPADLESAEAVRAEVLAGSGPTTHEYRVRAGDSELWIRESVRAVQDPDEGEPRLRGVLRDVTGLRRAEAAASETWMVLQSLVNTVPMGLAAVDANGYVTLWNEGAERILGWKAQEALGRTVPCLWGASGFLVFGRVAARSAHCGTDGAQLVRLERRDGTLIDVAAWSAPLDRELGGPGGALVLLHELAERHEAQADGSRLQEQIARLESELKRARRPAVEGAVHDSPAGPGARHVDADPQAAAPAAPPGGAPRARHTA